eukprot:scaffold69193_cov66-Phaeocystis_antarctica.AAC.3
MGVWRSCTGATASVRPQPAASRWSQGRSGRPSRADVGSLCEAAQQPSRDVIASSPAAGAHANLSSRGALCWRRPPCGALLAAFTSPWALRQHTSAVFCELKV